MAGVVIDSYSETNQDGGTNLDGTVVARGQSFTGYTGKILSVKFYLKKTGSPGGNAVAKLYAHTGTYGTDGVPTGSVLATSDNFDVSTLTTSYGLKELTFSGAEQYYMTGGNYYCIELEYAGNAENYVVIGVDTSSSGHAGIGNYYDTQWRVASSDRVFYVYKEDLSATTSSTTSSSTTSSSTSSSTSTTTSTTSSTTTTTSSTTSSASSTTTPYSDALDVMLKPRLEILPITPIMEVKRTYRHPN